MKIKPYSLEQLGKNYPVVNSHEGKQMQGGFSYDAEAGTATFTYEEMITLYGCPTYFPDSAIPDFNGFLNEYSDFSNCLGWSEIMNGIDHQIVYGFSSTDNYYAAFRAYYSDKQFTMAWDSVSEQAAMFGFYSSSSEGGEGNSNGNSQSAWVNAIVSNMMNETGLPSHCEQISALADWAGDLIDDANVGVNDLPFTIERHGQSYIVYVRNCQTGELSEYEISSY